MRAGRERDRSKRTRPEAPEGSSERRSRSRNSEPTQTRVLRTRGPTRRDASISRLPGDRFMLHNVHRTRRALSAVLWIGALSTAAFSALACTAKQEPAASNSAATKTASEKAPTAPAK